MRQPVVETFTLKHIALTAGYDKNRDVHDHDSIKEGQPSGD
jgi:hypothetical protein